MSLYLSDQNKVLFQYESGAYGATMSSGLVAGSGNWIGLVTDFSASEEENVKPIRYVGTSNRNVAMQINGAKDYEGTITYHPQNFRMFGYALGSCVDGGSPSPYSHVISEINSDDSYAFTSGANHHFPSFSVIESKKGQADGEHFIRTYKGCVLDSLSFTASQGEPVTCELGYLAQSMTLGSKTTNLLAIYDEDTSRPYIWSDVQFHLPSGTNIEEVTEVGFTINNSAERRHYDNGSKVVQNITPLNREYELSLTLDANSVWGKTLEEQYWQGGSTFNSMIDCTLVSGVEQGFIMMSGCKITSFESPSPSEGINEYSVTVVPESCNINTDDLLEKYNPW